MFTCTAKGVGWMVISGYNQPILPWCHSGNNKSCTKNRTARRLCQSLSFGRHCHHWMLSKQPMSNCLLSKEPPSKLAWSTDTDQGALLEPVGFYTRTHCVHTPFLPYTVIPLVLNPPPPHSCLWLSASLSWDRDIHTNARTHTHTHAHTHTHTHSHINIHCAACTLSLFIVPLYLWIPHLNDHRLIPGSSQSIRSNSSEEMWQNV